MNIVLIGMMGAGKTTVAKILAFESGLKVLDLDSLIEKDQGCSIEQIFLHAGEDFFRILESKMLKTIINEDNIVLSVGGGVLKATENGDLLKKFGKIVYLQASPDILFERIKHSYSRPLLDKTNFKKFKDLFEEREAGYLKADLVLNTEELSLQKIAHLIIKHFKLNA